MKTRRPILPWRIPRLNPEPTIRHVYLVCSPDRASLYKECVAGTGLELRVVHSSMDAVHGVVEAPGQAVLLDMASTLHAGVSETARLYDLGVDMPILRCSQGEDGGWIAMCQAPFKRLPLSVALGEIARGDVSWRHPKFVRQFVRVRLQSRVRFRKLGEATWRRGNTLSASIADVFILSLEGEPVGTELELELLDVGDGLIRNVQGVVTRATTWDDGPRLPGMGVALDSATVPPEYRRFLADLYVRQDG